MRFMSHQVRSESEAFLRRIKAERPPPKPAPPSPSDPASNLVEEEVTEPASAHGGLSQTAIKLLTLIAYEPSRTKTEHYARLKATTTAAVKAFKELKDKQLILDFKLVAKQGGQPCGIELLPAGVEHLTKMGIEPVKLPGRGSLKHKIYASRYLGRYGHTHGFEVEYEKQFPGKNFDVFFKKADTGFGIGVEIVLTNPPEHNAIAATRGANQTGIDEVWVCCETKEFLKKIEACVEKIADAEIKAKIKYQWLGDFWSGKE